MPLETGATSQQETGRQGLPAHYLLATAEHPPSRFCRLPVKDYPIKGGTVGSLNCMRLALGEGHPAPACAFG